MNACAFCRKTYSRADARDRHQKTCEFNPSLNGKFICQKCGKTYLRRDILARHVKKAHPGTERGTLNSVKNLKIVNNKNTTNNTNVGNTCVNSHNVTTVNKIYLSRNDPDFVRRLIALKGGEKEALRALKKAIYSEVKGEVELFGEMYCQGNDPSQWSVVCVDAKTNYFKIKLPDGSWLDDPGAVESCRRFYGNYTDGVLVLMRDVMFGPIVDRDVDAPDFPDRAGNQMDIVDLRTIQDRIHYVCSQKFKQNLFAKELTKYYCRRVRDIKNSRKDDIDVIADVWRQVAPR